MVTKEQVEIIKRGMEKQGKRYIDAFIKRKPDWKYHRDLYLKYRDLYYKKLIEYQKEKAQQEKEYFKSKRKRLNL